MVGQNLSINGMRVVTQGAQRSGGEIVGPTYVTDLKPDDRGVVDAEAIFGMCECVETDILGKP